MKVRILIYIVAVIIIFASITVVYVKLDRKGTQPSSITVTDNLGRSVTIPLPVTRVVSMDPSDTQMMYAIGAGSLLVADTSFDWWPSNSTELPHIEMNSGIASVEQVVNMTPDLILATTIQSAQIINQLHDLNYSVLVFEPQNISMIYKDMLTLGNVTGHVTGAKKEINYMKTSIGGTQDKISNYSRESLLYMMWPSPIYTAGPTSFIESEISAAGGINIANNLDGSYPIINLEQVVADNPQAIIVDNGTGISNISYFTTGNQSYIWKNISAVQDGMVLIFNQTDSNWMNEPGPLTVYAVRLLAQFLYPQAFK